MLRERIEGAASPAGRTAPILLLAAAAVLSRLPYLDRTLFISDSGRYALAVERYDVLVGRPHPPGNPLYIGLVRAVTALAGDPVLSLGLVSALAGGVAVALCWLLARDIAGEPAGALAGLALASSPLFWFFGEVGMPATCEAALSVGLALCCRRSLTRGSVRAFVAASALMILGFGLRSSFIVLVAPLWIWTAWRRGPAALLGGGLAVAAGAAGWSALVAALSGGWEAYSRLNAAFLREVVIETKILHGGWAKAATQAREIALSAGWGLGLFALPLALLASGRVRAAAFGRAAGARAAAAGPLFWTLWIGPSLALHAVYDWAPRFGVFFLPPALIAAAALLLAGAGRRSGRLLAVLAVAVNAGAFTLLENEASGPGLRSRNAAWERRDAALRERFDPEATLLLANQSAFHAIWFLPDYEVFGLFPLFKDAPDAWTPHARHRRFDVEPGSGLAPAVSPYPIPPRVRDVVFYDAEIAALAAGGGVRPERAAPEDLYSLPVESGTCMEFSYGRLAFPVCAGAAVAAADLPAGGP